MSPACKMASGSSSRMRCSVAGCGLEWVSATTAKRNLPSGRAWTVALLETGFRGTRRVWHQRVDCSILRRDYPESPEAARLEALALGRAAQGCRVNAWAWRRGCGAREFARP